MPNAFRWAALAALLPLAALAQDDANKVVLHESVVSAPASYKVIKRLDIGSWWSALGISSYATREEGAEALRRAAAELGGNGVINFGCYRKSEKDDAPFACNGTVVRFD